MENEDAILEFRIPVATAGPPARRGRPRQVVGLRRLPVHDRRRGRRRPAGPRHGRGARGRRPGEAGPGHARSARRGDSLLGVRFLGESPKAKPGPNPGSMALDYVQLLPASDAVAARSAARRARSSKLEKLQILGTTEGTTGPVDLRGGRPSRPPACSARTRSSTGSGWRTPAPCSSFRVPVAAAGRYKVTVGLAKSWDYGLYQCMVDGQDAGPAPRPGLGEGAGARLSRSSWTWARTTSSGPRSRSASASKAPVRTLRTGRTR